MNEYELFAKYYDKVMGDRMEYIFRLKDIIHDLKPGPVDILELGCGTGSLIIELANNMGKCIGIDRSPAMLQQATMKNSNVCFILGDITNFKIPYKFDVIICVFETINNLASIHEWTLVFRNCLFHLKTGGLVIFDMFTGVRLKKLRESPMIVKNFGNIKMTLDVIPSGSDTSANWNFKFSYGDDMKFVDVFKIVGKSYPISEVIKILSQYNILTVEDFRYPAMQIVESERLLFVLSKK